LLLEFRDVPVEDLVDVILSARDARKAFADELLNAPRRELESLGDRGDIREPPGRRFLLAFPLFFFAIA
jgi:hypothetical protein